MGAVPLQIEIFPEPRRPWWPWRRVDKGHSRCRMMADRHYTRQSPGHPMWTRPGYNCVLYAADETGEACFCWWRPKWEAGQERKDRLRVVECTIFRREKLSVQASDLVRAAVYALESPSAYDDLMLGTAGTISELITGVGSKATQRGRSRNSQPGECFRRAGWKEMTHKKGRADVWLSLPWEIAA